MTTAAPSDTRPVVEWLLSLGQALSALALYGSDHPSQTASCARAHEKLQAALAVWPGMRITLLDDDLVVGRQVLIEMRRWELGGRLSRAGVQRIEVNGPLVSATSFTLFLDHLHRALLPAAAPLAQAIVLDGLQFGPVALLATTEADTLSSLAAAQDDADAPQLAQWLEDGLVEELDTFSWISAEVAATRRVPMREVETVIRSLSLAMQTEQDALLPLVKLKSVDQYTTVHACNVAMLSMGLAESLGFGSREVRAVGTAALLHDIGKVRLPAELLSHPGALSTREQEIMRTHPVEGARLLGERGAGNALAAIVAYEHHIWANGEGGYPGYTFPRRPHFVSRLVQVCDVYDALSTERPYRAAWPRARTLQHMRLQAGRELDYELLLAFFDLIDRAEQRRGSTD
ncbi:HD domain-containing phosphohydrolase [Gemmatimonas sp.]|jgi:putative nucleotidyltransferase with HDIG domain|uniref:HD-GYP domain-containing protein n=1 Tax=Gemmatimonas sp. TaxID=1962908 RepID=UPI0022BDA7C6|nr:HD domain-containing phosphohydrolase [Gemmatimonas sp.]MCZ8206000.1 HD domain-containing protein [Gemmatimonas sp.]